MTEHYKQGLLILGSTGSIGVSTLDVVRLHPDRYRIVALTANQRVDVMLQQCLEFEPKIAVMNCAASAQQLREQLRQAGSDTEVESGEVALQAVTGLSEVDTVMAAIVGAAGLLPTLCAARAGKRVLLANKEALVMSGQLLVDAVEANGATLLPIDSEHNAIFQCLPQNPRGVALSGVSKILLTASGGPFREYSEGALEAVTPEQALVHPNWVMGRKITIDSATLMNKGLEVIEACWLFGVDVDRVEVVVHPQSVIHSMVSYEDGSVLAQLGNPDMRTPIAHALAWPNRINSGVSPLNFTQLSSLTFSAPDTCRFPCLALAIQAMREAGTATAVLNAANEVAVEAFLQNQLSFTGIPAVIESVLGRAGLEADPTLDQVLAADLEARELAESLIPRQRSGVARHV